MLEDGKKNRELTWSPGTAHLLLKLGRKEPAEWAWQTLLEENPDNYNYIKAFVQAKDADVGASSLSLEPGSS